jgi:hypothetical protein
LLEHGTWRVWYWVGVLLTLSFCPLLLVTLPAGPQHTFDALASRVSNE